MKWNRAMLAAFAVFTALMLMAIAPAVRADDGGSAAITTDKPDYHPEETVIINGTAFLADTTVMVGVTRPDGNYSAWNVTSDGSGAFSTSYQLDGITGTYNVEATDGTNTATTTFMDSAANLDQCTNGGVGDPLESCQGNNWVNGNANGQKAHWKEGEFISYRVTISGLTSGTHTLQANYDTVHGGKHAIGYLGAFHATETTGAAEPNHPDAND